MRKKKIEEELKVINARLDAIEGILIPIATKKLKDGLMDIINDLFKGTGADKNEPKPEYEEDNKKEKGE